jgi:hypothetical protein
LPLARTQTHRTLLRKLSHLKNYNFTPKTRNVK